MSSKKVRWGILSTANIGMQKVTPGIMASPHSEVMAIASRDLGKARQAADKLGIAKAYGSYEELFADPDIDAIYKPLPNHLHVPMTVAAAKAGKHVLCEKPIALNADDAEALRQCPPDAIVLEAFMVRFHPQWQRAREIIRSGELGEVRAINAAFTYFNADPNNVRNQADIGGGGVMDIGCYPITAARFLFEAEPKRVVSWRYRVSGPWSPRGGPANARHPAGGGRRRPSIAGVQRRQACQRSSGARWIANASRSPCHAGGDPACVTRSASDRCSAATPVRPWVSYACSAR